MLSARLDRYYGHLRRPPGWLPLPGSSPVIGRPAPTALRSLPGRGGPLQFPPPLSERSEPLTPGSPSRLHLQDLHRFHGLRPSPPGSALPCPTRPRAGLLTTRQASLDVTDRSVAHPAQRGARRWASTPPVSRRHRQPATGPPDSYPDRTYTGKRRRACESAINHLHDQPPTLWTHQGLPVSDRGHRARGVAVSPFRCVLNAEGSVRCRQCFLKWCCAGDEGLLALRSRPAGGGFKPPHAAGAVTRLW